MNATTLIFVFICIVITTLVVYTSKNICQVNEQFSDDQVFNAGDIDVYLINMEQNKDRLDNFVTQYTFTDLYRKHKVKFIRINGINGKLLPISQFVSGKALQEIYASEKTGYRTKHYQLTRGGVGCFLSHMFVYDQIRSKDKKYALIFEDDVKIDPDFYENMVKELKRVPNNWDILLLGCHCYDCEDNKSFYHVQRFFLLHAYLIKKSAIDKIYSYLENTTIKQQIDHELSDFAVNGILNIYCLKTPLSKQSGQFATSIQVPLKVTNGVDPYEQVNI